MVLFQLIVFLMVLLVNIVIQVAVWEELKRNKEKPTARAVALFLAQTFFLCYYIWAIGVYFILSISNER